LSTSILGIGIDLIEVDRIRAAHQRWGERFLRKVFTESEAAYCLRKKDPYPSLAARFAAKEAGYKAFSQAGIHVVLWRSLHVERDNFGRPTLHLNDHEEIRTHLALTHTRGMAMATVVIEARD
jgi:holo-[acyl-carrier protein] synthase